MSFSQNVGGTQNLQSSLPVCACSHYCLMPVGAPAAIALPSPSHALPAERFQMVFFADPIICKCTYAGTLENYAIYKWCKPKHTV